MVGELGGTPVGVCGQGRDTDIRFWSGSRDGGSGCWVGGRGIGDGLGLSLDV